MTKLKDTEDMSTEVSEMSDLSTARNFQMTPFLALVVSLIYMLSADGEIVGGTPELFRKTIADSLDSTARIIRQANIKMME